MKAVLTFVVLSLAVQIVYAQKKKSIQPQNDVEAIKAVIVKETKSFFETDKVNWKACWLQVPHAYWSFADSADVNYYEGWQNIEQGFADYFKMSKPAAVQIENQWDHIKVYGHAAFVHFRQKIHGDGIERDEQSEIRVLEKDSEGQWKIIHVGVIRKPGS
ncbi:MAG: hypothetical protein EBR30_22320 [Cytophagia bacterium]|nr:hypothetical protein [Cytophagia bacterium]